MEPDESQVPAPQQPTKEQLEANVIMSDRWRQSVRRGTFSGQDAENITTLLAFLDAENARWLAAYEQMMSSHPEWGRPASMPQPGPKQ